MPRISPKAAMLLLLIAGMTAAAVAQDKDRKREPPPRPTNLTVLPKDIGHDSLINLMKEYSVSLGVRCGFCHAPSATEKGRLDFASDKSKHKEIARYMMRMTADINSKYFARSDDEGKSAMQVVSCYTCHRGHEEPEAFVMPKEEEKH